MISEFFAQRVNLTTGDIGFEKNLKLYPSLPTAERVRAGIPGHQAKPDEHDSYSDGQDRCDGQGQITTYVDPGFADEVASSA